MLQEIQSGPLPTQYTLTTNIVGSGSITKNPNQATYDTGSVVQLTVNPVAGWLFDHWSGNLTGNTNPNTITMNSNKTVTAHFILNPNIYTLTIIVTPIAGGTVVASPDPPYHSTDVVILTATANTGYFFTGWSGDLTGSTNPTTITMIGNKTVTAQFSPITTTGWTAYNDLAGVASPAPATNYHKDQSGPLKDYATGTVLGVSVSVTGGSNNGTGNGVLPPGTDAYNIFNGKINPADYVLHYTGGAHVFTFTGLDPSKTYRFVHWADRAYPSYNNTYFLTVTISDVTSFNPNSSAGVVIGTTTVPNDNATYCVHNSIRGYVAGFTNINPGSDGDMTITVTGAQGKWYSGAFMVQELVIPSVNFTIIALPDTQNYASNYPQIFTNQTQWIVSHKDALNIVWVTNEGDITNGASDLEFQRADAAYDLLEDPATTQLPDGIPYTIIQGNHDHASNIFNTYFNYTRFAGRTYYGGHYPATINDNNYALFTAGGMNFIAIGIDMYPDANELAWADGLLQNNSDRRAIVVSHSILNVDGSWTSEGLNIYNALKDNTNLFLMLCGHMHSEARRADVYNGHTIYSVLADYQDYTNGGNGYLRIMTFCPTANQIKVKTYSPYVNLYETDANSQFNLTYNMTPILYTLTINKVGNGTFTPSSGSTYTAGTIVDVEAIPDSGWQFDHWSDNLSGTDNTTTITMNSNKTITATFTVIPPVNYILTINQVGSGTVTPASGNSYPAGSIVPVEAIPSSGWKFSSWTGDLLGIDNTTTITMNSNKTITATFLESVPPTVTLNSPMNNSTVKSTPVLFNITCGDNTNLKNATLYLGSAEIIHGNVSVRVSTSTDDTEELNSNGGMYPASTDFICGI